MKNKLKVSDRVVFFAMLLMVVLNSTMFTVKHIEGNLNEMVFYGFWSLIFLISMYVSGMRIDR